MSDSKVRKYQMTWAEVMERLDSVRVAILKHNGGERTPRVYGIPRGGAAVAGMLGWAVDEPCQADVLVDDIIDTGDTMRKWTRDFSSSAKPFMALVNKQSNVEDARLPWVVFPWECGDEDSGPETNVRRLLEFIGEDPDREGLRSTPRRVLAAFQEMTAGYGMEPMDVLNKTFDVATSEMVVLNGIRFASMCEHHLLPFTGVVSVGYIPDKVVVGISKLARLVNVYAKRLQVQERMTQAIAYALMDGPVKPKGVGVLVRATHQCMACRGVIQPDAVMVTSCLLGVMLNDGPARAEFLELSK